MKLLARYLTTAVAFGAVNLAFGHVGGLPTSPSFDLSDTSSVIADVKLSGSVSDDALRGLTSNRYLKSLSIVDASLSPEQVGLVGRLSGLQMLRLTGVEITDAELPKLSHLRKLQQLELDRNPITDRGLEILTHFTALKVLNLENTYVTDGGLDRARDKRLDLFIKPDHASGKSFIEVGYPRSDKHCSTVVYTLSQEQGLGDWSSQPTGRLFGHVQWSQTPSGRTYLGPFGQQAMTLRINGLPEHSAVEVDIELFVIGSWDGDGSLGAGPDIIDIDAPNVGKLMHSTFFNNTEGSAASLLLQSFPDPFPFGRHRGYTGASEIRTLGFIEPWSGVDYHRDAVYKLRYEFKHVGDNFELVITGMNVPQPEITELTADENWGIGGLVVRVG